MSFILDALRKSEHERQRQAGPGFAELRPAMARPTFPIWAIGLGALLAVNLVVLAVLMLRKSEESEPASLAATATQPTPLSVSPTPASSIPSPASTRLPASDAYAAEGPTRDHTDSRVSAEDDTAAMEELAEEALEEAEPELQPPPRATSNDEESAARLPTINDVALQGAALPELHLDIHVYAAQPAERFVFLNNRKYREGSETPEGTMIERITRDGVVLNHRGVRFLLPRQ